MMRDKAFAHTGLEIERKYLIRMPDEAFLRRMPACEIWEIEQIYLRDGLDGSTRRVRSISVNGETQYIHTVKRRLSDLSHEETEQALSEAGYRRLRAEADPNLQPIHKRRYRVPYAGQLLEIDIYAFWQDRATLEIELESETQAVQLPDWLCVLREISGERAYKNRFLAEKVPMEALEQGLKIEKMHVPAQLQAFFAAHSRIALAFSGGCDSAYLLYAAIACGVQTGVYFVQTQFQPAFELMDAQKLCNALGQKLRVLPLDVLMDERLRENPVERCYLCKRHIFSEILRAAKADGYTEIMDGTNASDEASDRPGMRALAEMHVYSPLRSCGMCKRQIRELSRTAGLFTWNKPAYACLATRLPVGRAIEEKTLKRVERVEACLEKMGFSDMRARVTERGVRLEVCEDQLALVLEKRTEIIAALEADFGEITLDLRPRREKEAEP